MVLTMMKTGDRDDGECDGGQSQRCSDMTIVSMVNADGGLVVFNDDEDDDQR